MTGAPPPEGFLTQSLVGQDVYVLFLGFKPISAHLRPEAADEEMASYTAEEQKSMHWECLKVQP